MADYPSPPALSSEFAQILLPWSWLVPALLQSRVRWMQSFRSGSQRGVAGKLSQLRVAIRAGPKLSKMKVLSEGGEKALQWEQSRALIKEISHLPSGDSGGSVLLSQEGQGGSHHRETTAPAATVHIHSICRRRASSRLSRDFVSTAVPSVSLLTFLPPCLIWFSLFPGPCFSSQILFCSI